MPDKAAVAEGGVQADSENAVKRYGYDPKVTPCVHGTGLFDDRLNNFLHKPKQEWKSGQFQ
ncbi:hypothetical protein SDC9_197333 [bioreactor metagenome]|uniref:Uncharacterized protein n=1 Tax=bioreactor metagenome TaxID=1076179 RepID=A0A645IEF9_9ZZZZ